MVFDFMFGFSPKSMLPSQMPGVGNWYWDARKSKSEGVGFDGRIATIRGFRVRVLGFVVCFQCVVPHGKATPEQIAALQAEQQANQAQAQAVVQQALAGGGVPGRARA